MKLFPFIYAAISMSLALWCVFSFAQEESLDNTDWRLFSNIKAAVCIQEGQQYMVRSLQQSQSE